MKKVIAINSSKRKGNTYGLIKSMEDILNKNEINLEIINLFDYEIKNCIGCEVCIRNDKCVLKDDCKNIMEKLIDADGIILSSPVYMASITGKMKTFIDRTCSWYHRPPLVSKPVLLVSTTAGAYTKDVLNYLEKVSIFWGMHPSGKISRNVKTLKENITDKELDVFLNAVNGNYENHKPTLNQLTSYQVQKVLANKILVIDKEHWEKQGWSNKVYYHDCKISYPKKIVANSFYKLMSKVVNPVK